MSSSSIPREGLVKLICDDLNAIDAAHSYFRIATTTPIKERLLSFTKPNLIRFIHELGDDAIAALRKLESAFPLYRPPTLYLSVIESQVEANKIKAKSRQLAKLGREGKLALPENGSIRNLYLPESAHLIPFTKDETLELTLHYERRIEIIPSDENDENYGRLSAVYSLETAFVWLPISNKIRHGVIACCDYPAVRHILRFIRESLHLDLYLPNLGTSTLHKLIAGALPRSVTFHNNEEGENEIQNTTLSDPMLPTKRIFIDANKKQNTEQTAGFYSQHPGLADGGIGIARRDGKIWTPKRLDRKSTAALALKLIEQTEQELAKVKDPSDLLKHFYGSHAFIGKKEIRGEIHKIWLNLTNKVIEAQKNNNYEAEISRALLIKLIQNKESLKLQSAIFYECANCSITSLTKCPRCKNPVEIVFRDSDFAIKCNHCKAIDNPEFRCECGTDIEFGDHTSAIRIIPEIELIDSIQSASKKTPKSVFDGFFIIIGTTIKVIARKTPELKQISLSNLKLWQDRARINSRRVFNEGKSSRLKVILNKTKEKCHRDGQRASIDVCNACNKKDLRPEWVTNGDTCLQRLFGVAIDKEFDGVHHGKELADIKYEDVLIELDKKIRVGIHVKSRDPKPPPEGMGRSKYSIKGLYTQLAHSAFLVRERGEKLDVIGVAIPNKIHNDAIASLEFMANKLGFTLLVISENDWLKVMDAAIEKIDFDS